jgi:membrane associated rhomboid family serine protease
VSDAAGGSNGFCYRHPDRQSFVLCQRCGRTICGECQTPGAVGVICPECMKEQRATAPRTKPAVLTRMRSAGRRGAPVVTYTLMGVSIVVYFFQFIGGGVVENLFAFSPQTLAFTFEPWRMLTSVFLHGSILHLLLNMYTLWIFGQLLEGLLGRGRFLALYVLSGLAGSTGVVLLGGPLSWVLGASGAIFGLMGAFVVIQRRLGANLTQLYILLAINLAIGFLPGANISWQAHLGGLVGGAIAGFILHETRQRSRRGLQIVLLILFGGVLVAIAVIVARLRIGLL